MRFIGPFITEDLPGGEDVWAVHAAFCFLDSQGVGHDVPTGFITDGASIPRFLWSVVGHPRMANVGQAAALHDKLYREGTVTKARADQILCEGMECLGANWLKRQVVLRGLQLGGWLAWERYRRRPVYHFDP